jgi:hypothetical protein
MRKEHEPDAQISIIEERVSQLRNFTAKDLVRNLGHYPGPVACFRIRIDRAAMHHIAHRSESVAKYAIRPLTVDGSHESYPARIMLFFGLIQRSRPPR